MDCGSDYPCWWAPTDLFLTVIGGDYGPSLLCIDCFHSRAHHLGIRLTWRPMTDDEAGPFIEADTAYAIEKWQASNA